MWKYDNLSGTQRALLKNNTINFQGDVDSKMALYVQESLLRLTSAGSPDITVFITGSGGEVSTRLDIYDFLRLYLGKKVGKVFGFARSMAVIILQACNEGLCSEHADILIHHINRSKITLDEIRDENRLSGIRKNMETDQEKLYNILCKKTKKDKRSITEACSKDTNMTAEQALDFGLIDGII